MNSNSDSVEVKAGDLDKLGLLFERYNHRLISYFYRLTRRQDISEDLVQVALADAMLELQEKNRSRSFVNCWTVTGSTITCAINFNIPLLH